MEPEPVFARIANLERRREALRKESATPAELEHISKAELEELRHLARPPEAVRKCLEVVYAALHVERASRGLRHSVQASNMPSPSGGHLAIAWDSVRAMLVNFETFFPAMREYDIAPLVAAPALANYLSRTYFVDGGLTVERVSRSSKACASLFRWCSKSMKRAQAALELLDVDAELIALRPHRWRCEADDGWFEFVPEVDAKLNDALINGLCFVPFELCGERYEVNIAARTRRNMRSGSMRPVRPPGEKIGLCALQGNWQSSSLSSTATVWDTTVVLEGREELSELEVLPGDGIRLICDGVEWVAGGSPLRVVWSHGTDEMVWVPVMCSAEFARSRWE
eukprot:gnl/TRDRNA2_/TRDRNA2_199226_c0_seq1.p1 gnl/TRDRNA2_/TRDRNA2_199226_c0~~gnl/TRDRNA2_/TRDRNA2_199226_c0_seq1.p1  ORF type:complete len:339 (-),score=39.49 gnl/TRDRNA2_/TRDRNA2_199226_c0_seq1:54-1070(-)